MIAKSISPEAEATAIILDDHRIFAESFAVMLEHHKLVNVAFTCTNPQEVRSYILNKRKGIIYMFLDCFLSDVNVLQLINDIRRLYAKIRMIVITSVSNPLIIRKILAARPDGLISKSAGLNELVECLNSIKNKRSYLSPYFIKVLETPPVYSILDDFTAKEMEVFSKLIKGESIGDMANSLNISKHTVIVHRRNMLAKSGVKSVVALLALAVKGGVIISSGAE